MYRLGSLACTASLAEPAFHFGHQSLDLQRALFRNLRMFDPKINDITETVSPSGVAKWSLTLAIPAVQGLRPGLNFFANVSGVATTFLTPGRDVSAAAAVLDSVESAVREVLSETQIYSREFTFHAHLSLPPAAYQALTAPFLKESPQGLDTPSAHGVSFYFDKSNSGGGASALILDRSAIIPGGLFFQVQSRFEAGELAPSFSNFLSLLERAIEATNLGGEF
jgi:hypothetical protein